MPAPKRNDEVTFETMTSNGRVSGTGKIAAVFPTGDSCWLHILQPDGAMVMLFEADAEIRITKTSVK